MSGKVFRFEMSQDNRLVDINAAEEIVSLSKEAVETYASLGDAPAEENSGLKKFIREQIDAVENDGQIRHVKVLDENGLADLVIEKVAGKEFAQIRCEYRRGQEIWNNFVDTAEIIYLREDSPKFEEMKAEALKFGVQEIKSTICTSAQCEQLAALMHIEEKVSGVAKAVFFPHEYTKEQAIKLIELRGVIPALSCAKIGGAVAIASNVIDVMTGEKTVAEAAGNFAKSYAEEALIAYAGNEILATAVGQVVKKTAYKVGGTAVAEASTLLNSTSMGTAIFKGGSAIFEAASSGAAFLSPAASFLSPAAAIFAPITPFVAPATVAYLGYKLLKKIF